MNPKIAPEHLHKGAVVYVRQSTMAQVTDHTESKRRQYALADAARAMGFVSVETIDEDLGRSGSGLVERPGFQRLVGRVCSGSVGAVFCIEASRLVRNGRDWHHLVDLCALVGTLIVDGDGTYEPRLINDRLLLGLKGTMSEYELNLLRQRGLAARDSKAKRGELRFGLPPGYCWNELGKMELEPDERVVESVKMVFQKFRELGSVRQVMLWAIQHDIKLPVVRPGARGMCIEWRLPAYHNVLGFVQSPLYAGAYAFGRTENRVRVVDGRAHKTAGHARPLARWPVLMRDHHPGYITWDEYEKNQTMLAKNAHMKKRASRKAARGGRALLTGMLRCARCGRMLHVFYGMRHGNAHRYMCRGDELHGHRGPCIGIGGVRVDKAVAEQIVAALQPQAVAAAIAAAEQVRQADDAVCNAVQRELEEADYEAKLAERRHAAVDPDKRLVARELEKRWEAGLERANTLRQRLSAKKEEASKRPTVNQETLLRLAADLGAVWNAPTTAMNTKQRLARVVIQEVIADVDNDANEVSLTIHWFGGRHTTVRISRTKRVTPNDQRPNAVDVMRKLGGRWPDLTLAVTLNRTRCRAPDGGTWTTARVRELRDRLGVPAFDPAAPREATVTADEAAHRLQICVGSVRRLIRAGVLPATQLLPGAPWEIPAAALDTEAVRIGSREIQKGRPRNFADYQAEKTLKLPGF